MKSLIRTFVVAVFGLLVATVNAATYTLTADEDWSSRTETFPSTVDLKGHKLTVTQLLGTCTITDSNAAGAGGELHINVEGGKSVSTASVTLSGSLKVVKKGAGVLDFAKTNQPFKGGIEVVAGTIRTSATPASSPAKWPFGGSGTAARGATVITIDEGATFDINGKTGWAYTTIDLNGGTISGQTTQFNATVNLLRDSYFEATGDTYIGQIRLNLNGFTLNTAIALGKSLYLTDATIADGTFDVVSGGVLYFDQARDFSTVDFKVNAAFKVTATAAMSVHDYEWKYREATWNAGSVTIKVFGTFTPTTECFYGCEMQNGSTLNLASKTGPWSTTGTAPTGKGVKTVTFAAGATVTIDVGDRELHKGDKVVSWSAVPENVVFRIVGKNILTDEMARLEADGIYYTANPDEIVTAVWTGAVGGDVTNPGNWSCTNAVGNAADPTSALPGEKTEVILIGEVKLQIPADTTFAAKSIAARDVSLAADCDWSGLTALVSGKIDLKGRNLTVSQLAGDCEITDSNPTEQYERLEYIEATSGQYVDTGVIGKTGLEAEIDMLFPKIPSGNTMPIASRNTSSGENRIYFFYTDGAKIGYLLGNGPMQLPFIIAENTRYLFRSVLHTEERSFSVDGDTKVSQTTTVSAINSGKNLFLFASNNGGSPDWYSSSRVYGVKIGEGGILLRAFVPVKRVRDGKIGLLDLANPGFNEFYVNKGTGDDFMAGEPTGEVYGQAGELHVNCASDVINVGAVSLTGGLTLVKDGLGTLTWNVGTIASNPILITNGVFKLGAGLGANVFGNPGTIIVKGRGQFDLNITGSGDSPVLGKTFEIEGDGPDGMGAIVNTSSTRPTGNHLKSVILTGNATIGGTARIDFRSGALDGNGHALTVKNTDMLCFSGGILRNCESVVLTDKGVLQPCANTAIADTVGSVILRDGVFASWGTVTHAVPIAVEEGGGTLRSDSGVCTLGGTLAVCAGATLALGEDNSCELMDVVNNGTIEGKGMSATIAGMLRGSGAITGTGLAFGPSSWHAGSSWHVECDENGFLEKADFEDAAVDFLASIKRIDVLCSGSAAEKTYDLAPAKGLTAAQAGNIVLAVTDATTKQFLSASTLGVMNDRLVLTVRRDMRPVIAHWTGAAGNDNIDDTRNWACSNWLGEAAADTVPCEVTIVHLSGDLGFGFGEGTVFPWRSVIFENVRLTADCDWRVLPNFFSCVPVGATIDLNGHKLFTSTSDGNPLVACTITDAATSAECPGEFHLAVAADTTFVNDKVLLSGGLKVVKEGDGVLDFAKTRQPFKGGVEVAAGTIRTSASPETSPAQWPFGGNGIASREATAITIDEGATFEINGKTGWGYTTINLNGGTISGSSTQFNATVNLLKTSYFQVTDDTKTPWMRLNLNGFTLNTSIALGKSLYLAEAIIENGIFDVTSGGVLLFDGEGDFSTVDFKINAALKVTATTSVHDYEWKYRTGDWNGGSATIKVFGTFTPTTDCFYGCEMQNGSTLNLASKESPWSTTGAAPVGKGVRAVTFAPDSKIDVIPQPGCHGKIISWLDAPKDVVFKLAKGIPPGRLTVEDVGLYLSRGMIILLK